MDNNDLILKLIKEKYKSIRQFSIAADIPYSTVKSGLKAGIRGMAVETVIKMCAALHIQMDDLMAADADAPAAAAHKESPRLSADEYYLVEKYRSLSGQSQREVMNYMDFRRSADKGELQKNVSR